MNGSAVLLFTAIFLGWCIDLLELFIFLRIILSWFPIPPGRVTGFLRNMTDPIFRIFARLPFAHIGMLDLTPLLAYFGLQILAWALDKFFLSIGVQMISSSIS